MHSNEEAQKNPLDDLKLFGDFNACNAAINAVYGRNETKEEHGKFYDDINKIGSECIYGERIDTIAGITVLHSPVSALPWVFSYVSPFVHFVENLMHGEKIEKVNINEWLNKLEEAHPTSDAAGYQYAYTLQVNELGLEKAEIETSNTKLQYNVALTGYKNALGNPYNQMSNADFEILIQNGSI